MNRVQLCGLLRGACYSSVFSQGRALVARRACVVASRATSQVRVDTDLEDRGPERVLKSSLLSDVDGPFVGRRCAVG